MLYGFVNAFISFKYQWTYIFIIRWISYGSHNLTCYYHCCFFLKWHSHFLGFVFLFMDSLSPRITTPTPLPKICWSGNAVYTSLPLHPYHSITTPEWQCSVNLHICDALQCHSGVTLQRHSKATPKVHFNATPECTLHCHSITTTPMPLSQNTPMPLRSVFGVLICIFATHSYATPMPLQYHSIRLEWHRSVHSGLWK